jgi:NADH dehydrogenase
VVTGATGYLGSRLAALARGQGWPVTALVRRPQALAGRPGVRALPLELGRRPPAEAWEGAAALVHLMARTAGPAGAGDLDWAGSRLILEEALAHGVERAVFLSSLAARPDAPTAYGRDKARVERLWLAAGGVVLRAGVVYGGPEKGQWGQLCAIAARLPVAPLPAPATRVQPVHRDEVCAALLAAAAGRARPGKAYNLGLEGGVAFGELLRLVARERYGRRLRVLPLPVRPLVWAARLSARLPGLPSVDPERVAGVGGIRLRRTAADLAALGVDLRPVARGLAAESRCGPRRRLVREALALTAYILGRPVGPAAATRYVRRVEHAGGAPLGLPGPALRWPRLLRLWDPGGGRAPLPPRQAELRRRLDEASLVAECTPAGARRFAAARPPGRAGAWLGLAGAAAGEALRLPAAWLARRLWR